MIERGGGERFAPEPFARHRIGLERERRQLDRDAPLEARVMREEHFAHPAGAEQRLDPVPAREQVAHGRMVIAGASIARAEETMATAATT